jgi:hypothetical protein
MVKPPKLGSDDSVGALLNSIKVDAKKNPMGENDNSSDDANDDASDALNDAVHRITTE